MGFQETGTGSSSKGSAASSQYTHLVVVIAGLEPVALPCVKVIGNSHRSGSALACANRKELAEGGSALNGWLVDLGMRANLVRRAIARQRAACCATVAARIVAAVLNNVVLCDADELESDIRLMSIYLPVNGLFNQPYTV